MADAKEPTIKVNGVDVPLPKGLPNVSSVKVTLNVRSNAVQVRSQDPRLEIKPKE